MRRRPIRRGSDARHSDFEVDEESTMNTAPTRSRHAQSASHPVGHRLLRFAAFLRRPVVAWVGVLLLATFSFYVHLLREQVERGEQTRAAQRSGAMPSAAAPAAAAPLRVNNRAYR
jgi:hypothetical protein